MFEMQREVEICRTEQPFVIRPPGSLSHSETFQAMSPSQVNSVDAGSLDVANRTTDQIVSADIGNDSSSLLLKDLPLVKGNWDFIVLSHYDFSEINTSHL